MSSIAPICMYMVFLMFAILLNKADSISRKGERRSTKTMMISSFVTTRTTRTRTTTKAQNPSLSSSSSEEEEQNKNKDNDDNVPEIPANLKRKIQAKRPELGHVVPKKQRQARKKTFGGSKAPELRPQGIFQSNDAIAVGLNNPSNLKILGGIARGRRLDSPNVYLRPMMGKVREAVFSTFTSFGLYDQGSFTKHLDIFAGSGSVGLESLSRGASHCTFVDLSVDCCAAIQRNIALCQFDQSSNQPNNNHQNNNQHSSSSTTTTTTTTTRLVCADASNFLRNPTSYDIPIGMTFDIITLCPPYEEVVYNDLLNDVANSILVTEDTIILIEYPIELGCLPHVYQREDGGILVGVRNRRYGRTVIAMYIVNPTGCLEVAESRPEEFVST